MVRTFWGKIITALYKKTFGDPSLNFSDREPQTYERPMSNEELWCLYEVMTWAKETVENNKIAYEGITEEILLEECSKLSDYFWDQLQWPRPEHDDKPISF